jgi:pimeloyl-ACP methyl ester carboxylesterase
VAGPGWRPARRGTLHVSYRPRRPPRRSDLALRGLRHCVLRWGPDGPAPLVFLHGWADTAASFQFLVDAFATERPILALDWRGFGDSEWTHAPYWFPDYLADLDALLQAVSPSAAATLVGHSMGGNVAALYGGIRPERVRAVVNLEGFGLKRTTPADAPERYRRWLEELRSPPAFGRHGSRAEFAAMLARRNPRLGAERAAFVAECWTRADADGRFRVSADPAHKLVNPVLYRREEAEACWRRCTAPVLLVFGGRSEFRASLGADASDEYFGSIYPHARLETIPEAGHMLHHEDPEALARLIEPWLAEHAPG